MKLVKTSIWSHDDGLRHLRIEHTQGGGYYWSVWFDTPMGTCLSEDLEPSGLRRGSAGDFKSARADAIAAFNQL